MNTAKISDSQVENKIEGSLGRSNERSADAGSHRTIVSVPLPEGTEVSKSIPNITAIKSLVAEIYGPVTLEKMWIKFFPISEGDGVGFVLTRTGGSISKTNYMQKLNAKRHSATAMNAGVLMEFEVPIPAGLAKQISPISGDFPGLELFIKSYGSPDIVVFFELGIHGDRMVHSAGF